MVCDSRDIYVLPFITIIPAVDLGHARYIWLTRITSHVIYNAYNRPNVF